MAYFYESSALQARINTLDHIIWSNNITRLNASNLNKMCKSIKEISKVLCDNGNSNNGLIQQFDGVRQLVQGDSAVDYSIKGYYAQLEHINKSLYGYRFTDSACHYRDVDYQLGDLGEDDNNNLSSIYEYFLLSDNYKTNDYSAVSGVLGKLYWKYMNQDELFIKDYQRFRNIFKAGYTIDDVGPHIAFGTTSITNKPYGIYRPHTEEMDGLSSTLPFYFDWRGGICFQDIDGNGTKGFKIDDEGSITPFLDKEMNLGSSNKRLGNGYFHNVSVVKLMPDETSIDDETGLFILSSIGDSSNRFFSGYFGTVDAGQGIINTLQPYQDSRLQNSKIGLVDAPYNKAYISYGYIYDITSTIVKTVAVEPHILTDDEGNSQPTCIGRPWAYFSEGYIGDVHASKISASGDSATIGTEADPFSGGYFTDINSTNGYLNNINSTKIYTEYVLPKETTVDGKVTVKASYIGNSTHRHTESYIDTMHTNVLSHYNAQSRIGDSTNKFPTAYFQCLDVDIATVQNQGSDNKSVVTLGAVSTTNNKVTVGGIELGENIDPTLSNILDAMFEHELIIDGGTASDV